jgi:hypothetical protein
MPLSFEPLPPIRFCGTFFLVNAQFLTDERELAVVLPREAYEELLEDIADLAAIAERREEEHVSLEQVKQRLIADGLLPG